ncbi:MAG: WbqC family protein [Sphingobacteriia bacterium]|nr:WbqC family protein [Sphingobacteriia bacterium]
MLTAAVMQPYFIPYAGYYRLFAATNLFVIFDCVQFPRRGWVHRNKFSNDGKEVWLTLPIEKCPQETLIKDLHFHKDAQNLLESQLCKIDCLKKLPLIFPELDKAIKNINKSVVDYIIDINKLICNHLNIEFNIIKSSTLDIDPELKAQDRILAILRALNANHYINPPGGRDLYDANIFQQNSIKLEFLSAYEGNFRSILERIIMEDKNTIREEIFNNCNSLILND